MMPTITINSIVASQQRLLNSHPINHCAFMTHWSSGQATKQHFRQWLDVQLCASVSFGWVLKAVEGTLPKELALADEFYRFAELASVEYWPLRAKGSHGEHFKALAQFMGFRIDLGAAFEACPPAMLEWLEFRESLGPTFGPAAALLTLAAANEVGNLTFFKTVRQALDVVPGLADCPPEYLDAHLEDEGPDAFVMVNLAQLLTSQYTHEQLKTLRQSTLRATQQFLDLRAAALKELYESFALA